MIFSLLFTVAFFLIMTGLAQVTGIDAIWFLLLLTAIGSKLTTKKGRSDF